MTFFSRLFLLAAAVAAALLVVAPQGARAARSLNGLPTAIFDLFTCQNLAQYINSGTIPPNACNTDTQNTIRRCMAELNYTQIQTDAYLTYIGLYCAAQAG